MGVFDQVGAARPGRSSFNLSHSVLFDGDFGKLYPISCMETLPGDVFTINANVIGRLSSSLVAPMLGDMDIVLEAFYVPTRLLMGRSANFDTPVGEVDFEEFITGGKNGEDYVVPYFNPTDKGSSVLVTVPEDGIADYLGVQTNVALSSSSSLLAFPWRAYRWIWNEYYRNEFLMDPIQVCQFLGDATPEDPTHIKGVDYDKLLNRSWRKDYFTSSLPFQQFGNAPAFDISGQLPVIFDYPDSGFGTISSSYSGTFVSGSWNPGSVSSQGFTFASGSYPTSGSASRPFTYTKPDGVSGTQSVSVFQSGTIRPSHGGADAGIQDISSTSTGSVNSTGYVDLANAVTFDVSELRTAFQIQKWAERCARGGIRYTEYLKSHFGVSPSDSRLQRPYFIGSFRKPWYVSEVLQTSSTDSTTPQGNQAGQAINLTSGYLGKFRSYEFGYILILASILPKAMYQQGIPRYLSRISRLDWNSPEFNHLSEQAVKNRELFVTGNDDIDNDIFGFQGIWNELRYLPSRVAGHMRTGHSEYSYDYWHMARYFAETPVLNKEFLEVNATPEAGDELHRIFAQQTENPFIVNVGLNVKAIRPLPYLAEPGLVDHF